MKMSVLKVKGLTKFYQSKGAVATTLIFLQAVLNEFMK